MRASELRARLGDFEEPITALQHGVASIVMAIEGMCPDELRTKALSFAAIAMGDAADQLYQLWVGLNDDTLTPANSGAPLSPIAEMVAEWRRREADVKAADNRADLAMEEDDRITGLAIDAFRAVKEAPAANVDDMLLKLRCVAEAHRGKALTDEDGGALHSFLQVLMEDAERLAGPLPVVDEPIGDALLVSLAERRAAIRGQIDAATDNPSAAAVEEETEIERRMMETPAQSLAGVAIKAGLLVEYSISAAEGQAPTIEEAYGADDETLDRHCAFSIWADLQRLMKGGVS